MALPGRSSRKTSNTFRLVFGPSTCNSPPAMMRSISSWSRSPSTPTSANPAAKTTANFARAATASRRIGSGSPTRIATRSSCSSMSVSALAQGRPATTGRFGLTKYTVAPRSSAQTVIFWVRAVLGRALESEAPTTATRRGRKKVSRSMERRAVGRPVMSVPSPVAVVPVAMSLPRAAPPAVRSAHALCCVGIRRGPSGAGAVRRARSGPAGALTVYDVGVSVDPDRRPIVPGGGHRRIVDLSRRRYGVWQTCQLNARSSTRATRA